MRRVICDRAFFTGMAPEREEAVARRLKGLGAISERVGGSIVGMSCGGVTERAGNEIRFSNTSEVEVGFLGGHAGLLEVGSGSDVFRKVGEVR